MIHRSTLIFTLTISSFVLTGCQTQPTEAERITITIAGGASGQELDLTVAGTRRFMEQNPDIRVLVIPTPRSNHERLSYYKGLLQSQSDEVDVFQIDVVWTGIVANHALDLGPFVSTEEIEAHFPSIIENNTIRDRLVALPWFADAPSLFYRTDLLEEYGYSNPPSSWTELQDMAKVIMAGERNDNLGFWGYIWQGADYEGLTCNALEWQYSSGGGNFIDSEGNAHVDHQETVNAMSLAASWIGTISPPQVLEFDEESSRLFWQKGDAAFLRHWSNIYALTKQALKVGQDFAVAPLPGGPEGSFGTLGGWQLMVNRYSHNTEAAVKLVRFLTAFEEQKIRAIEGSYNPTIRSLYKDSDVLRAVPFFAGFETVFENLVVRPSSQTGEDYDAISRVYSSAVHDVLNGQDVRQRLADAEQEMQSILAQ